MKTYREISEMHYGSDPNIKTDTEYKRSRISALEKLLSEQLNTSGVVSRFPWSLEEKRYLWDSLSANHYEYGRYVLAAKMQNAKFNTKRSAASCRAMDRKMLWRP